MRISKKKSWWGYSSNAAEKAAASMRLAYEKSKQALEAELTEFNKKNHLMLDEMTLRIQEIAEDVGLEKELEGLLQHANVKRSIQTIQKERPELFLIQKENK